MRALLVMIGFVRLANDDTGGRYKINRRKM